MERMVWLVLAGALLAGCVSESDYESSTGTFSIPWGEKEGKNLPAEDLEAPLSAM